MENLIRSIGVVIPTYNRVDTLLICLKHLEMQTWKDFEVVIVDDGSTDSTQREIERYQADAPFPLRYFRQPNSGPASARNRGVQALESTVCLFLGDDIFASADLLRIHWEHHRDLPNLDEAAVGFTRWSEEGQTVTRFMQWLDRDGAQFAYGDLLGGLAPSWKHFYTSNLSLKTEQLRRYPFDERFRKAAMEDIELGYRLATEQNLTMSFLPTALAQHFHPTTFRQACKRMISLGASAHLLGEIWPEFRMPSASRLKTKLRSTLQQDWILARLTDAADVWTEYQIPNPLMKSVLSLYSTLGYRRAAEQHQYPKAR